MKQVTGDRNGQKEEKRCQLLLVKSSRDGLREMAAEGISLTGASGGPTGCRPVPRPARLVWGGKGGASSSDKADSSATSPWEDEGNQGWEGRCRGAAPAEKELLESRRERESERASEGRLERQGQHAGPSAQ